MGYALLDAVSFALMAWALMMVILMPLTGSWLFGLKLGPAIPVATFVLPMSWGTVLGLVYDLLRGSRAAPA